MRLVKRPLQSVVVLLALLMLVDAPLAAWEQDVHSTLTFWLAVQAGFSREGAFLIARSDQSLDDSNHTAAIGTVVYIILTNSEQAGRELQKKHFPSDAIVKAKPQLRPVRPNSPSARKDTEAAVLATNAGDRLNTLGEALHPFQDSWSHQGVPDIPFGLREDLASGHPKPRGGWKSHDADLTHLHVDETIEVAHETYEILRRFLQNNPSAGTASADDWQSLEPIVREFAIASNRDQKDAWAAKYVPEQGGGGRRGTPHSPSRPLTLPGPTPTTPVGVRARRPPGKVARADSMPRLRLASTISQASVPGTAQETAPAELVDRAQKFLNVWLQDRAVSTATKEWVDLRGIATQFSEGKTKLNDPSEWSDKFLTMVTIDDHSAVNAVGHGDPEEPGYKDLPRTPAKDGRFRSTRAINPITVSAEDFLPTDVGGRGGFGLVLNFGNLPHDSVTFVWQKTNRGWSIARMFALPD